MPSWIPVASVALLVFLLASTVLFVRVVGPVRMIARLGATPLEVNLAQPGRSISEEPAERIDMTWSQTGACYELRAKSDPSARLGFLIFTQRYAFGSISEGRYSFVKWPGAPGRPITIYDDSLAQVGEIHPSAVRLFGTEPATYAWRKGAFRTTLSSPDGRALLDVSNRSLKAYGLGALAKSQIGVTPHEGERSNVPLLLLAVAVMLRRRLLDPVDISPPSRG